jgi:gas vesicle protein
MPEVAERAQQVQEAAQEQVQEKAEQARGRLRDEVDTRSTEIGEQVSGTSEAIREAATQLREKGQDGPARATEQAAEKMEQAGRWLTESDADRILSDVEDFARRQPWAVLAGGLVVGFAASRFLKSSSQQRHGARGIEGHQQPIGQRPQPPALADGNGVV